MVLGVAALTSVLFQKLKQPAVLGYLLAGMIVGPHVPVPLVADLGNVRLMGELGVILLMFTIGLEFSLSKLLQAGPQALLTGTLQVGTQLVVGFLVARPLGWPPLESAFFGASLAIASTMILAKLFDERGIRGPLKDTILGVLLVEDLHAVLLLAALTAAASLGGPSAGAVAGTLLKLAAFLAVLVGLGRLVVPRAVRWVADHARDEVLLVVAAGLCFGLAQLAVWAGFSVAMGAFVAGMLVCESGRRRKVEHLVHPLRDLFAAMFFVAVGMLVEPAVVLRDWPLVLLFTALVIVVNALSVTVGATLAGLPLALGVQAGLALGQVGEFGFIPGHPEGPGRGRPADLPVSAAGQHAHRPGGLAGAPGDADGHGLARGAGHPGAHHGPGCGPAGGGGRGGLRGEPDGAPQPDPGRGPPGPARPRRPGHPAGHPAGLPHGPAAGGAAAGGPSGPGGRAGAGAPGLSRRPRRRHGPGHPPGHPPAAVAAGPAPPEGPGLGLRVDGCRRSGSLGCG